LPANSTGLLIKDTIGHHTLIKDAGRSGKANHPDPLHIEKGYIGQEQTDRMSAPRLSVKTR
jgi:hypothetical protein